MELKQKYGLFIGGEFVPSENDVTFEARNPANGALITTSLSLIHI